jgi:eukaryotic-like serine/threonine-protein kinase
MTALEPLILPADVEIVPVGELSSALREQLGHADSDFSVTRPRTRTTTSIVDAGTASLLERFRSPTTIVDAVIAYSAAAGVDPRTTLDQAFAVLGGFVNQGLLVAPDSELARPIATTLAPGDTVGNFEILASIQVVLDTEVYLARARDGTAVAVKLARQGSEEHMGRAFAREAAILAHLDARVTPRLLGEDELENRPFLAMSWCAGVDVYQASSEARRLGGQEGRATLLELADRIIGAYSHLHSQKVLHGDVHPRNVLVDGGGEVTILDFGLAVNRSSVGSLRATSRGGIDFFMEPEVAQARIAGSLIPELSTAGEQYSLGALLYLLLTGGHTHTFALEQEEMLRQLVEEPPLPFVRHGIKDMQAVEGVLTTALAKQPQRRYSSVADMHDALRDAAGTDRRGTTPQPLRRSGPGRELLEDVLARLAMPGGFPLEAVLQAPSASVQNGAAGFAYALLRIAGIRADEVLLGEADLWCALALYESSRPEAFRSEDMQIVPEVVGESSLYHGLSGVHAVASLIAGARGDEPSRERELKAFVDEAQKPCEHVDVAFGRAGLLLGCALLRESQPSLVEDHSVEALGAMLRDSLMAEVEANRTIFAYGKSRSLGAAHGWAGILFSLLRWCEVTGAKVEEAIGERLAQLAALSQPLGRSVLWPYSPGEEPRANPIPAGWCNGTAGYVSLWTLASRLSSDDSYMRLAQAAAWGTYEDPADVGDLCCGLAGRAYALLSFYRHGGGDIWLTRAHDLADRAAASVRRSAQRRDSLYKGEVGVALLVADLEDPLHACMPLFEGEGWQTRPSKASEPVSSNMKRTSEGNLLSA